MFRTTCLTLALLSATPLAAQGFNLSGTIDAGVTGQTDAPLFGAIDATAALRLSKSVPLGFEFGTYTFALDGKNPHETYAAFTWDDRFKLGALRPAYDAVLPSVFEHVAPYLAYSRAEYARSFNTIEAMRRTAVPWGLSAQGTHGGLDWIVSVHDASSKGGFRSASAAVTYHGQGYQLMAAVEDIQDDSGTRDGVNAKIGARMTYRTSEFGIAYLHPEANNRPDALALDARFAMGKRVALAVMGEFTENAKDDAYGVALSHDFREYGTATLAATDGAAGQAMHLTYSYRF